MREGPECASPGYRPTVSRGVSLRVPVVFASRVKLSLLSAVLRSPRTDRGTARRARDRLQPALSAELSLWRFSRLSGARIFECDAVLEKGDRAAYLPIDD